MDIIGYKSLESRNPLIRAISKDDQASAKRAPRIYMGFSLPVGVFKNRNYRLYFFGQLISMSGSWMQGVAQSWLVYRLSHSGYWLGVISLCSSLPAFFLSPMAGVIADRFDRRKILIAEQIFATLQALTIAALVFSGTIQLWHLVVLSILLGLSSAFEMTTRHAFAVDLVGKEDLGHAIALNSILVNGSRIVGPACAGLLIGFLGEAWCFLINALSFIPVIWGLIVIDVKTSHRDPHPHPRHFWKDVIEPSHYLEALRYVRRSPVIFRILILSTFVCLVGTPFSVLLPVFVRTVLNGDAKTLGWLTGMMGVGAIAGAISFTRTADTQILKQKLVKYVLFLGFGIILLGVSRTLWLSLFSMFAIGYFMMSVFPTMNNAIQRLVDDEMRGRTMSLYTMTFLGATPLGSLMVGVLSDHFGAARAAMGCGVLTAILGVSLIVRETLRPRRSIVRVGSEFPHARDALMRE